jgi:hypothetical protein
VLDLAVGSDSTLIADHRTGRRVYLYELDAVFAAARMDDRFAGQTGLSPDLSQFLLLIRSSYLPLLLRFFICRPLIHEWHLNSYY